MIWCPIRGYVKTFIERSMESWKTELTSSGESLGQENIRRGIFQGDSLSPLLFVICMIPLSLVLRKVKAGYEFRGKQLKINHLLFMVTSSCLERMRSKSTHW